MRTSRLAAATITAASVGVLILSALAAASRRPGFAYVYAGLASVMATVLVLSVVALRRLGNARPGVPALAHDDEPPRPVVPHPNRTSAYDHCPELAWADKTENL